MSPVTSLEWRHRREHRARMLSAAAALVVVTGTPLGVLWWSAPRHQVPLPGPEATAVEVGAAHHEAIEARDFDTANAIDDRPGSTLSRLSLPVTFVSVVYDEPASRDS